MTDDAALVGAVVGGVGGALGAVAAIVALIYAHKANKKADASNTIAGASKNLAVEANDLSRESNAIAVTARELAAEANSYSHRAEAREVEHHDVRWDDGWLARNRGIYAVIKRGDDPAHNVRVTVEFDGQEQTDSVDLMEEEGGQIRFQFRSAAAAYAAELEKYQAHQAAVERHNSADRRLPFGTGLSPQITSPFYPEYHSANVRVTWTTALGTPKTWEQEHRLMTFGFS